MAFIEAAPALWIALVTIDHELSFFSCPPSSPPVRAAKRETAKVGRITLRDDTQKSGVMISQVALNKGEQAVRYSIRGKSRRTG